MQRPTDCGSRTSGDLLADRRFTYAQGLSAEGNAAAAGDLLEQTLERVPHWVPAWVALGCALERQGLTEAAIRAFARGAALDPAGLHGAGLHLARLGDGAGQRAMPPAYVAALFDDYAERFDSHLVDTLGYRGPQVLAAALAEAVGDRRLARAVDLGCGTGLMGLPIRARVDHLTGIDLSAAMVAQAARRGVYDRLVVEDLTAGLAGLEAATVDLVVAADVMAYVGPLGPVVQAAAGALRPGGVLGFTVQHGRAADVELGADLRFFHSARHVADALAAAGFDRLLCREASVRRDAGADVPGLVVVARKP